LSEKLLSKGLEQASTHARRVIRIVLVSDRPMIKCGLGSEEPKVKETRPTN